MISALVRKSRRASMSSRLLLVLSVYAFACNGTDSASSQGIAANGSGVASPEEPPPLPPRRTLPDAVETTPVEVLTAELSRLDMAIMRANGTLQVEVNDPDLTPYLDALIDGDPSTLVRSNGVNPLVVTLTFTQPVRVTAVRIFPTYSLHDWVIEPLPGEERLLVRDAPGQAWSSIELDQPTETAVVRVEVLRLERDDFVHLNEIELYD
jgi:hypothetical protein